MRLLHLLPHFEGEGKTELSWDQSECCFLSLLLSDGKQTNKQKKNTVDQFSEEARVIIDEQFLYSA